MATEITVSFQMLPLDKGELSSGGLGGTATHGSLLCLHSPYSRFPET